MTGNSACYEFSLSNQFFTDIDAPEIQKGKLQVRLDVKKSIGVYVLDFHIEGYVVVPCDRCLDDMELPVVTDETLKVKLGTTFADEDEMVIVPEEDGCVNVAWFMYEFIALSIPIKHVHDSGKCNKSMSGALGRYLCTASEEECGFADCLDADSMDSEPSSEREPDPRWNELKKILDNN